MEHIVRETTKMNISFYLEADRSQNVSYDNGLKRHLLSIKTYISFKC